MKSNLLLLFSYIVLVSITFTSCNNDDDSNNTDPVGDWKLTSVYSDPGDGSGDFVVVKSDKTLTFEKGTTVSSNYPFCNIDPTDEDTIYEAVYSIQNATITAENCEVPIGRIIFEVKGNILTISYSCVEACQSRYTRI